MPPQPSCTSIGAHFSADVTCNGAACVGGKLAIEDFDAVIGGARVKF